MTGKFKWTREIPPAAEWFDFDREEKTMLNPPHPEYDDDLPDDLDEVFVACPLCGSSQAEYEGEVYDDEHHEGSGYHCLECDHHFTDGDRFMMD